jgi:hypothetical protein
MATDIPPQNTSTGDGNGGIAILFAGILAGVVLTGLAMVFLMDSMSWDWKTLTGSESPNLVEAWRNIGFIALGIVGVGLATWRSILAHQQNQNAIAQRRISERGMNVERYQKGAQMLESDELSVRIAGIYGLRELAISDPKESYIIVQSLLFAFIREKSRARKPRPLETDDQAEDAAEESTIYEDLSLDILEALDATKALRKAVHDARHLEKEAQWRPSLASANLSGARLVGATLPGANLIQTNLSGAILFDANLSGAILFDANLPGANLSFPDLSRAVLAGANLSGATLHCANLSGTYLRHANLSGANFSAAKLSKHTDLTGIWAWADRPPRNMPPEIEAAITYRDPAERKDDD